MSRALEDASRQYLVGELRRPQPVPALLDARLEIGVTSYARPTSEAEHFHTRATEYQYVVSGWTQYLETEAGRTHDFIRGDFYAIHPMTRYAQRSAAGTTILFVKAPGGNDKVLVESSPETLAWMEEGTRTVRTDYFHDPSAPQPNSVRPAAAVFLRDGIGRVLLVRRADNGKWTLPGGTLEMDESLHDCAVREVREETGLDVDVADVVATYTDPDVRVGYSDGEVRREFTIVFAGKVHGSPDSVTLDAESTAHGWFSFDEIADLAMADSQRRRIADCVAYLREGRRNWA